MKLLSAEQIKQWDAFTIAYEPITSIDLMERAALRCVGWMEEEGYIKEGIQFFCGKGNNGGDGLAMARLLFNLGHQPKVYIIESGKTGSVDFNSNLQRLQKNSASIVFLKENDPLPIIKEDDIIVDALFGSGINRALDGCVSNMVKHINQSSAPVISIDLPSGMMMEKSSKDKPVIRATHTLCFQQLKRCLLMPENAAFFGKVTILEIGLDPAFLHEVETELEMLSASMVRSLIQARQPFSHKGTYGHALLLAGSKGKMGAAVLAARACLRSGVGLLTVAVEEQFASTLHTAVPEAMLTERKQENFSLDAYKAIGMGPGTGVDADTAQQLHRLITLYDRPMLIDADALTILSMNKDWLEHVPKYSILTPHPKEFDRLFGQCENDFERTDKAIALSKQYSFVIVLKGHYTLIAANGKGWYNTTGNAGLAKGGSGDVLSGMLTAFLAQQYPSLEAAMIGVYLHGLAADIAVGDQSVESLLATDVIEVIGKAFKTI